MEEQKVVLTKEEKAKLKKERREERDRAATRRLDMRWGLMIDIDNPPEEVVHGYRYDHRTPEFLYLVRKDDPTNVLPIDTMDYYDVVNDINSGEISVSDYDYARDFRKKRRYFKYYSHHMVYDPYDHYINELRYNVNSRHFYYVYCYPFMSTPNASRIHLWDFDKRGSTSRYFLSYLIL
jgi:hypothetical protein